MKKEKNLFDWIVICYLTTLFIPFCFVVWLYWGTDEGDWVEREGEIVLGCIEVQGIEAGWVDMQLWITVIMIIIIMMIIVIVKNNGHLYVPHFIWAKDAYKYVIVFFAMTLINKLMTPNWRHWNRDVKNCSWVQFKWSKLESEFVGCWAIGAHWLLSLALFSLQENLRCTFLLPNELKKVHRSFTGRFLAVNTTLSLREKNCF